MECCDSYDDSYKYTTYTKKNIYTRININTYIKPVNYNQIV